MYFVFFFKQKTAYEMRISDWSSDVCSSDLISKIGDVGVRTALYEAANVIMSRPVKGSDLKTWALAVGKRAGPRKARVALARKLAVILHHMLRDGTTFIPHRASQ